MIHHGDCLTVLRSLEADSIDACVTDPPYGIGFMGKKWDQPGALVERQADRSQVWDHVGGNHNPSDQLDAARTAVIEGRKFQGWTEQWAREVFRVLKPGAYIVVCGAPRSHHRMMCGLEDAGFVVRDCFAWLFGSGFPKNYDLGDGKGTALKPAHEPIALAWKPFKGTISACHAKHGTAALNIEACRIGADDTRRLKPASEHTTSFPHSDDAWEPRDTVVGSEFGRWPSNVLLDEDAAAMLDEQTGELVSGARTRTEPRQSYCMEGGPFGGGACSSSSGGASRFYLVVDSSDSITYDQECERSLGDTSESQTAAGIGNGESREVGASISNSNIAGSGSALTDQSIEATRSTIGTTTSPTTNSTTSNSSQKPGTTIITSGSEKTTASSMASSTGGASDAENIDHSASLLSEAQEPNRDIADAVRQPPSPSGAPATESTTTPTCGSTVRHGGLDEIVATGQAPALRFKYCPKPSREERDFGCDDLPQRSGGEATDRSDGSAGLNNPRAGAGRTGGARNVHPTVKPVELMRWLVRLVTPPNGLVLDPFLGSGTTGMACRYESRQFIGIEREADYIAIADRRIAAVAPLFAEEHTA